MFSFTQKQNIIDVFGIKIGGQPGKYPTVLIAGLFFKGKPNYKLAEKQISEMYELSKKTGNPAIPDFFIKKEDYIQEIINFIEKVIPKNKAFSIDIIDPKLKVETLKILSEKKLLTRTIYNSIHIGITDEEKESLKKCCPKAAIVVAFNPKDKSPDGKIEVLENGANLIKSGLIDLSKEIGKPYSSFITGIAAIDAPL
jgi:tetrahydromethanopterin S-methyltransferase subunit H